MTSNIRITHFVNPHLFYYKSDEFNADLDNLEEEILNELIDNTCEKNNFQPKSGDVVAFLHKRWAKWIRVVVDKVLEFTTADPAYVLWAIDYGIPFESTIKSIHPLSKHLRDVRITKAIICGSIINCVPATNEYNFMSNKVECQEIEKWSELAVNAVSELIKASTTIRFERCEAAPSDDRNYGELTFDLENGVVDAAETLIFINQGLRKTETEFFRDIKKLETLHQCPWKNNQGSAIEFTKKDGSHSNKSCNIKTSSAGNQQQSGKILQKPPSSDEESWDILNGDIETSLSCDQQRVKKNVQKPQSSGDETWDMSSARINTHDIDSIDAEVFEKVNNWYIANEPHALNQCIADEAEQVSATANQTMTSHKIQGSGKRHSLPAPSEINSQCQPQLKQCGLRQQLFNNRQPRQPHASSIGNKCNGNNRSTDTSPENNEEGWNIVQPDINQQRFFGSELSKKLPAPSEIDSHCQPQMKRAGLQHRIMKTVGEPLRLPHFAPIKSDDGHSSNGQYNRGSTLYSHREDHGHRHHASASANDEFHPKAQTNGPSQKNESVNSGPSVAYIPSGYETNIQQFQSDNRNKSLRTNQQLLAKTLEPQTIGRGKKFFG